MRKPALSVLGAAALGSAAPALGATSIAHELAFAPEGASPGFETPAADTPFVFEDLEGSDSTFGALGESRASLSFAAAESDAQAIASRGMLNATVLAVPEPTTWWAMIIGLGVIGYALRTRKRPLPQAV